MIQKKIANSRRRALQDIRLLLDQVHRQIQRDGGLHQEGALLRHQQHGQQEGKDQDPRGMSIPPFQFCATSIQRINLEPVIPTIQGNDSNPSVRAFKGSFSVLNLLVKIDPVFDSKSQIL